MGLNALPLRLYRHPLSGHAHRVALFLSLLSLPFEAVDIDLAAGAHKRPEFLRKNPFGQVPVLEDGDVALADSNAILVYLALRYDPDRRWYPTDPLTAARIQRWLSVAAGELAAGPATARMVKLLNVAADHDRARNIANHLFGLLDRSLAAQAFLVGAQPTIADVALHSYTAHAPEGGVSLEPYPNVTAWLRRIEALPRFVPMQRSAVPPAQPSAA